MRSIDREKRTQKRVYQYATGRGGVPIGKESPSSSDGTDVDYQYASGRGGVRLSRNEMESQRESHYGKGPKGWKRSDESIREEVCEALFSSYDIDASDIDVTVNEGLVTLKGTVDSRSTKRLVEDVVDDIAGVQDVQNQILLRSTPDKNLKLS